MNDKGPLYLSEVQAAMAVGVETAVVRARTVAAPGQVPLVPYHVEGIHGRAYNLVNLVDCFDLTIQWALRVLCGFKVSEEDSITISCGGEPEVIAPKAATAVED
jgi:hypothetical protein